MRRVVVLPHPDGPSIEKNSPRSISSDRASTATTSWNRFVTRSSRTSIWDGTPIPRASGNCPSRASTPIVGASIGPRGAAVSTRGTARLGPPMDFALSPQHEEIRRTVRSFAEREIMPVADEMERKGEFPHDLVRRAAELGLLGVPYPEDVGGTGLDSLAYAITIEELSRASGSMGIIVSAHTSLGCNPIYLAGTDEQKERFLRPLLSGAKLGAYGLTESEAGSDSRGTRTRAHRDGNSWVLNGSKRFITNAGVADTYIVTALTDRDADSGHISAFIVDSDAPGFAIGRLEEEMGLHASRTGELLFDDCRIPAANLLGPEGEGDRPFLKTLRGGH